MSQARWPWRTRSGPGLTTRSRISTSKLPSASRRCRMTAKPIRIPGPDHPITIEPSPTHVVVSFAGKVIADTRDALILREASYPPVLYIPRGDADMTLLERSDNASYCPYKGDASYYSIATPDGDRSVNAI